MLTEKKKIILRRTHRKNKKFNNAKIELAESLIMSNSQTCVTDFIKENSFAADATRRESTRTGSGVGMKDIRNHVLEQIPGLIECGISLKS